MAAPPGRPRLVVGRLIMVPAFAVVVVADTFTLDRGAHSSAPDVLGPICAALALAFYALAIWCYLRRRPAIATSRSLTAHGAASAATWLALVPPLLHGAPPAPGRQALADVCWPGARSGPYVRCATSTETYAYSLRLVTSSSEDRTAGCVIPSMWASSCPRLVLPSPSTATGH